MSRTARKKNEPLLRPVQSVELKEDHVQLRVVLICVLLFIAGVAIALGVRSLLNGETGWREIGVSAETKEHCGDEFVFTYEVGCTDMSLAAEVKKLTLLYSQSCQTAYRVFHATEEFDGVQNLCYVNNHVGETVAVDPILYAAFAKLQAENSRVLYLAPLYAQYRSLFACNADWETEGFDPYENDFLKRDFAKNAAFCSRDEDICLRLLEHNTVRLEVSDAYRQYMQEQGLNTYLDFFWLKNAFIADYLADVLTENGFTSGMLASYDGFTRNLDGRGNTYLTHIYRRSDNGGPAQIGTLTYHGPCSLVCFKSFPTVQLEILHYYVRQDGQVRSAYIDRKDGLCKAATDFLLGYAAEKNCADIALQLAPLYITDAFSADALPALEKDGLHTVFAAGAEITYTAEASPLQELASGVKATHLP